jgi:hypothetical protein
VMRMWIVGVIADSGLLPLLHRPVGTVESMTLNWMRN